MKQLQFVLENEEKPQGNRSMSEVQKAPFQDNLDPIQRDISCFQYLFFRSSLF